MSLFKNSSACIFNLIQPTKNLINKAAGDGYRQAIIVVDAICSASDVNTLAFILA